MKKFAILVMYMTTAVFVCSCGGSEKKSKTFQPNERVSSLNESQKRERIDAKKAEMSINMDTLLYARGVKLSVVPPMPDGKDITEDISERMAQKMLQITTSNGIGGINNVPNLAFTARLMQTERLATGTAPQKMMVKYAITWEMVNMATGDVYASLVEDVSGVGDTFEAANKNMTENIKNSSKLQKFLSEGSRKIINWYDDNLSLLKKEVSLAESQMNYAYALALVESVPQEATETFAYALKEQGRLLEKLKKQHAADLLVEMKTAIAEAQNNFTPKVAGYLKMLPADSPEYKEASQLYASYQKAVDNHMERMRTEAEKDHELQRKMKEMETARAHEKELAQIEADKIKFKYECKANAIAMEKNMRYESDLRSEGFFSKLGNRILSGMDYLGDKCTEYEWED